jgi:hypothetical protein
LLQRRHLPSILPAPAQASSFLSFLSLIFTNRFVLLPHLSWQVEPILDIDLGASQFDATFELLSTPEGEVKVGRQLQLCLP